jgi:hypothetical protein
MMDDHHITALLEKAVEAAPVSVPPVHDVTRRGQQRLRWQRSLRIGGTAAIVAAVAIGSTAIGSTVARSDSGSSTLTTTFSGQPPTRGQLLGRWHLASPKPSLPEAGPREDPNLVTFTMQRGELWWFGYDGCNWFSGPVLLGTDGSFRTPENRATMRGCLGISTPPVTGASVIEHVAWVRLRDWRLTCYNRVGRLVGSFVRVVPAS